MNFSAEQLKKIESGDVVRLLNGKRYGLCQKCGKLVCLDKMIFHSLHLCVAD